MFEDARNKLKSNLFLIISCSLFCTLFTYNSLQSVNFKINILIILAIVIPMNILFYFVFMTKKNTIIFGSSIFIVILASLFAFCVFLPNDLSFKLYFELVSDKLASPQQLEYSIFFTIIMIVISTLAFNLLIIKSRQFYIAFALIVILLIRISNLDERTSFIQIYSLGLCAIFLYMLGVLQTHRKQRHFFKRKEKINTTKITSSSKFIVFITPLILIIFCIIFITPSQVDPTLVDEFNNYYISSYNSVFAFKTNNELITSGAFRSNSLDGKANPGNQHVLTVTSDRFPIYLKCGVKNEYTGSSWNSTLTDKKPYSDKSNEMNTQLEEYTYGRKLIDIKTEQYFKQKVYNPFSYNKIKIDQIMNKVNIQFKSIKTKNIFTPLLYANLNTESQKSFIGSGGEVYLNEDKSLGYSYELNMMSPYTDMAFYNFCYRGLYQEFIDKGDNSEILTSLKKRSDFIYDNYTQLPTLPDRVKTLANDITTGSINNCESVSKIKNYLQQNYEYTLDPPKRPSNQDVVDYFLFDSKKGYCTSFATSMTVLVRSLGIPARYCVGYYCKPGLYEDKTVQVTNKSAHAWVEVYFEGIGWESFEATTSYPYDSNNGYDYWSIFRKDIKPTPQPSATQIPISPSIITIQPTIVPNNPISSNTNNTNNLFIMSFLIVLALLIGYVVYYIKKKSLKRLIKKLPIRESLLLIFSNYIKTLNVLGYKMQDYDTVFEFYESLKDQDAFFKTEESKIFIDTIVKTRYSNQILEPHELTQAIEYSEKQRKFGLMHKNKFKYLFYRYVLCFINI